MATSRPPPHLITTSLSRRPLRASPAPFLTASSCLARSSCHSTTPTVQAPPFLPNPAPSPQEALKVDPERGERSQARHSALDSSHTSLSFTHLFIYYRHRLVLCSFLPCFSVETCSAFSFLPSTFSLFTCLSQFFCHQLVPPFITLCLFYM